MLVRITYYGGTVRRLVTLSIDREVCRRAEEVYRNLPERLKYVIRSKSDLYNYAVLLFLRALRERVEAYASDSGESVY